MIATCARCKKIFKGSEIKIEILFNNHVCKNKRDLMELDQDLILRVINKEITEDEAWILNDKIKE